jgi:DNA polymerase III epsilon subunit-like protein
MTHLLLTPSEVTERLACYPPTLLQLPLFAFYDTESTGLSPQDDHIISIGCVLCLFSKTKGFEPLAEFHQYIKTTRRMDPVAAAVHHITPQMLNEQGQSFEDVMIALKTWFQETASGLGRPVRTLLMAHNGHGFDDLIWYCNMKTRVPESTSSSFKLTYESLMTALHIHASVDTMKLLRFLMKDELVDKCPKNSNQKVEFTLGTCFSFFCQKGEISGAHDALVDTWALVDVMNSPTVRTMVDPKHFLDSYCKANITYYRPWAKLVKELERGGGLKIASPDSSTSTNRDIIPGRPLLTIPEFQADDPDQLQLCMTCMCYGTLLTHRC